MSAATAPVSPPWPRRDAGSVPVYPRGRDGASTCRIAAKRLRPRRDAGATGHNARERDTGERRDAGAATASTCRIAARRLRRPRRDAGATGHDSARERDTGERRAGAGWVAPAGSRSAATRTDAPRRA